MIHVGDCRAVMSSFDQDSIDLSLWSPPYHVGKEYEAGQTYEEWVTLISDAVAEHSRILKPGAFCVINIADILCFPDESMPKIQAEVIGTTRISLTATEIRAAINALGTSDRHVIAAHFGVSEQTIDRRLNGNNVRGGKYGVQTRVHTVAGLVESSASQAGLYLYDRRVWVKDPAWANSRWTSNSFRAVDEFEHLFVLWKPGVTTVNRNRLSTAEWTEWGSRAVWHIPSVRRNDNHPAKFPDELPRRVIRMFTDEGGTVLDPFAGSGTTVRVARELGRHGVGIELNPEYANLLDGDR